MDEKIATAVATTFALYQIQLNAMLLLLQEQHPTAAIRENFQRLTNEGVQEAGLATMEAIKKQLLDAVGRQQRGTNGDGHA